MNDKLKPCPFCGGEAALHKIAFFKHEAYVRCKTCGVRTLEFSSATMEDAKLKAIEAWNRRAGEANE